MFPFLIGAYLQRSHCPGKAHKLVIMDCHCDSGRAYAQQRAGHQSKTQPLHGVGYGTGRTYVVYVSYYCHSLIAP